MKANILWILLYALLPVSRAFPQQQHQHDGISSGDLGNVNFPISCAEGAQQTFTRAIALLYSFEYEQAQKAFEDVARTEPSCAMAYWGQAMSLYHQLWDRPSNTTIEHGRELIQKAGALKSTAREHDYIRALGVFYAYPEKRYEKRPEAYEKAMRRVASRYPDDREAQVLYALSLLGSGPEHDPNHTHAEEAVAILSKLFDKEPSHPGVAHYIIHACDNPQMAGLALPAARKYATIAPASAHAVHMPSHIFARLGLWQDDIQSNLQAIEVADQQAAMHMHTAHHRVHSMDFLEYAYLQIGDDANAKKQVEELATMKVMPGDEDFMQDYLQTRQSAFPVVYAIERRQWKEALALEPNANAEPYAKTPVYWGRAVAAGHLHDPAAADGALKHYDELVEATEKGSKSYMGRSFKQQRKELVAWADYAAGKPEQAVHELTVVADEQDRVGKGETELPAREMLADMLLESGRPDEALKQYEISLKTDPNRFNGLYGSAQAASQLHQNEKAAHYSALLIKNCDGTRSDRAELPRVTRMIE